MVKLGLILLLLIPSYVFASERSLYEFIWLDPDKKVYVLQNKLYEKEYKVYFEAGYLSNETSKFQDTNGFQLKTGWYFREEWGLELFYNQYSNRTNDDYKSVRIINTQVPFIRRFNSAMGIMGIWSPFYGKINTFNRIFYFDWSFGLGAAAIEAESNLKTALQSATTVDYDKETYTGAVLKTNLKFHLRENIHLGLEYMNIYYKAPSPKNPKEDKIRTNTDIIFLVGFSL